MNKSDWKTLKPYFMLLEIWKVLISGWLGTIKSSE